MSVYDEDCMSMHYMFICLCSMKIECLWSICLCVCVQWRLYVYEPYVYIPVYNEDCMSMNFMFIYLCTMKIVCLWTIC